MASNRDDFSVAVKRVLANRVCCRCSNPDCERPTSGPTVDSMDAFNLGVAAHIAAAAPGGPRFDPSMTPEQRKHADNGVWLCRVCGTMIDEDTPAYTVDVIREWKIKAESKAEAELKRPSDGTRRDPFANMSRPTLIGPGAGVELADGRTVGSATCQDWSEDTPTYYAGGAFVVRFMVQKRKSLSNIIISEIRGVVHTFGPIPEFRRLYGAYPYEVNLYLIELQRPLCSDPASFLAERYFEVRGKHQSEAKLYEPLLIKDDIPETIDVRLNAREPGLYKVSLEVSIYHGVIEQKVTVMSPQEIIFEKFD